MTRFVWNIAIIPIAWGCAGCANTASPDAFAPAPAVNRGPQDDACRAAADPSAACLELLTRPEIESRTEVEAAEAARQADAFRGRLAGLRAAEEQRQQQRRVKTATAAVARLLGRTAADGRSRAPPAFGPAVLEDFDPPPSPPEGVAPAPVTPPAVERRRQASAPRPSPGPDPAPGGSRAASIETAVAPAAEGPAAGAGAPTPEFYLRGGRCLLQADRRDGMAGFTAYRRRTDADRNAAGRWALVLADVTALADRVEAEMTHRKLAKPGPVCMSSRMRPVVALLRSLVGPPPSTLSRADGYGRGLGRLERELQVRAGLPPAD